MKINYKRMIISFSVLAVVLAAIIVTIVLVVQHVHDKSLNTYEAQMQLAEQEIENKDYEKAEAAYKKALKFKAGDREATVNLAELYVLMNRVDDAVKQYLAVQEADDQDVSIYKRLLELYIEKQDDIEHANEQILKAYELGLELDSEHVAGPPVFSPEGGVFNQATSITIKASKGYKVYYTTKPDKLPTKKNKRYKKPIVLSSNKKVTICAIAYNKQGLMSWPATQTYKLKLEFMVDASAIRHLGSSASTIMKAVGPLFYDSTEGGGCYYVDTYGRAAYIFPMDSFYDSETKKYGDPVVTPLPGKAVCVAVNMPISQYIVQQTGEFKVKDFMKSQKIKDYSVERSNMDGAWHLYFDIGNARYDMTLRGENTISTSLDMTVYLI